MTFRSIEEQNAQRTEVKNAKTILPREIKEWNYADNKDLSMNLGGILHDVTPLVAAGVEPTPENIAKFKKWLEEIYRIKNEVIEQIKKS